MKASIIVIGDELLIGQVVDTNSGYISQQINALGLSTKFVFTVGDNRIDIEEALQRSFAASEICFMTGGLGPTKDDITKSVLCNFFDTELVLNESVLENVKELLGKRGITITENNYSQALVPASARVINNAVGTAPCLLFTQGGKILIVMPGVPFEMKYLMQNEILPYLRKTLNLPPVFHKTLLLTGIAESILANKIEYWENSLSTNVKLAYLPAYSTIRLRLSVYEPNAETENYINKKVDELHSIIGEYIISHEDIKIEELLGRVLKKYGQTVCTAESCTGGRISSLITSVSGSSEYFKGSVVSYSNEVKENILGVNKADLENYGAVSKTVAEQMAIGAKKIMTTDYAISTTGIAGPTGGSEEKPVGTVWMAVATPEGVISQKLCFGKDRIINIERFAASAITMLIKAILTQHSK